MVEHLTESQRILQSRKSEVITDSLGRGLEVRRLGRAELMRLMRLWGPACNTEVWLSMAVAAASVMAIDERPIPMPRTTMQVEGVSEMLGDEGFKAIEEWFQLQGDDGTVQRAEAKN